MTTSRIVPTLKTKNRVLSASQTSLGEQFCLINLYVFGELSRRGMLSRLVSFFFLFLFVLRFAVGDN